MTDVLAVEFRVSGSDDGQLVRFEFKAVDGNVVAVVLSRPAAATLHDDLEAVLKRARGN